MGKIFENIKIKFDSFSKNHNKKQKITMAIVAFLVVIITTGSILYATRPQYEILYKDLQVKDAASITKNLDELKIKYKVQDPGTILVQKQDLNKAKMDLSLNGMPPTKFSYEDLLNKNNMFMSEEEKQKAYNYALQNQIGTIIEEIPSVDKAYVTLSIPKASEFILDENKQSSKASVFLELKEGSTLDKKSVDGIATLVANSVEGLSSENVTIHDSKGKVLNQQEDESYESSSQLELQKKVSDDLDKNITEFLESAYGYGNVSVKSSVKLNFDTDITESKTYDTPIEGEENGLVRSVQSENENVKENSAQGVPGVDSNATGVPQYQQDDSDNSAYDKKNETINYELNEVVQKVEKAKGQIQDITVAVIINSDVLEGNELTADKQKEISKTVSAATGIDTKAVEVSAQPFNSSIEDSIKDASANKGMNISMWAIIAMIALIIIPLIGFGVYMVIKNKKKKELEDEMKIQEELLQEKKLEMHEENIKEIELDIKESGHKKSIESLVKKNPELVSQLLKSWVNED